MKSRQTFSYSAAYAVFLLISTFLYMYTEALSVLLFWSLSLCFVIIEGGLIFLYRLTKKKNIFDALTGIFPTSFRHAMILAAIMALGSGGTMLYYNEMSPATLSLYTITNGEKTVQFQQMAHIATPGLLFWSKE